MHTHASKSLVNKFSNGQDLDISDTKLASAIQCNSQFEL